MKQNTHSMFSHLKLLFDSHELMTRIVYREIHSRYRQSLIGIGWAFIRPVVTVLILTVVFSVITKVPSDNIPYPLFAFSGLLPWLLFNNGLVAGVSVLPGNSDLVANIYFPREILPLAAITASGLDFLIAFFVYLGLLMFYQVGFSWYFLYVCLILLVEIFFLVGMTFLLSMLNVWYRDITHSIGIFAQLWMYLTPVIYPFSMVPEKFRALYALNPLVGIVEGFRSVTIRGEPPDIKLMAISALISLLLFLFGYKIFKAREFEFADVI
jgi:lipopolysaccharide transport system permease protein